MTDTRSGAFRIARLAVLAGVAKAPGFLIPLVIAAFFGAGHVTDAYFLAYGGVLLVGGTIGQPLEVAIVPFTAHALALGRRATASFMHKLVARGLIVGGGAALVGAGLLWGGLKISHPDGVLVADVSTFYLLLIPAAVAWCVAGVYSGSLVSAWQLEISAIGNAFRGLGALTGAVLGIARRELWPVALGVSVGEWGRVWWLRRRWRRVVTGLDEGQEGTPERGFALAAGHQIAAQGFLSGAQFIERFLVGTVAVAAISHVEYALRLVMIAAILFDGGIGPWLLARWSTARVRHGLRSDWLGVYRPLATAALVAVSVSGVLIVAAPVLVRVILQHGAFTAEDAASVTLLLRWYGVGYCFNMGAICIERLLLARAQNRLFARLAALRASARLVTVVLLLGPIGILALPAGMIVSEFVYLAALLFASRLETASNLEVVSP